MANKQIQQIADEIVAEYKLTYTEGLVLFHVLKGRNNKEIGEQLNISEKTVKIHIGAILTKTESHSRSEVQAIAMSLLSQKHVEAENDLSSIYDKWTSIQPEMDKRKSRNFAELQHPKRKNSTKDNSTKDLEGTQSEQTFDKRGGNGE